MPDGYTYVEWPKWMYPPGGGPGRIFHKDDQIPSGWSDDPHAAAKAKSKRAKKEPEKSSEVSEAERQAAIAELREHGIEIGDDASIEEINARIDEVAKRLETKGEI